MQKKKLKKKLYWQANTVDQATAKDIRRAAMDLLARREHSFKELTEKLSRRFNSSSVSPDFLVPSDLIEQQLTLLAEEKLQSDQRFAKSFVRYRISKYQGAIRIKNELRERGVAEFIIEQTLAQATVDWRVLLQDLSINKYGVQGPGNDREKAKRIRFFQYRGFGFEQIKEVL